MSRYSTLAALVLVALWLPVTMHCQLEAAGLLEADDCCIAETAANAGSCKADACPTVEDALYKESSDILTVNAPAESGCAVCLALADTLCNGSTEPELSPARHAPPMELKVAWQFSERAAPPARAPGALNT